MKIYSTNNKVITKVGIGVMFILLGFLIGMFIVNFLSPSKITPNPTPTPIPTNYSLKQKNYKTGKGRITTFNNGNAIYSKALTLNNGLIIYAEDNQYFIHNTLINISIKNIWILNGVNKQYALITTEMNITLLYDVNDLIISQRPKPLVIIKEDIDNSITPVVFDSFINIFCRHGNDQQCIKIDTRSFEFKIIKIFVDGKQNVTSTNHYIQQGNIYTKWNDYLYVIDIKHQLENTDNFNFVKLFQIKDSKYTLMNFNDDYIINELNKDKNYNVIFRYAGLGDDKHLIIFDKNGTEKLDLKDCNKINEYTFGFSMKENNKVNLINIAKSVFNDKPVIFSKEITNSEFAKSFFFVQLNNDLTYSIVIYNQHKSLLDIITLDKDLNQNEIFKIKNVNDFNFDWLNNNSINLQISIRPVVFIFQKDCYYITTPNQKSILLWKNEQLIKKYEDNWADTNNVSPFLFELNNVPIIATKNEFIINDEKYKNETIFTLKEITEIYTTNKNVQININDFSNNRYETSIIYLKSINEN